jgi:hypothetical protein
MPDAVGIVFLGVEFEPNAQRYVNYIVPSSSDGHIPCSSVDGRGIHKADATGSRFSAVAGCRVGRWGSQVCDLATRSKTLIPDLAVVSGLAGCVQVSF